MDFQILSEKVLQQTIIPGIVSYCPSMDLIALATKDQGVYIFRLNGERVCGISQQTKHQVERIHWKQDGQLLAVAWSNSSIQLISPEGGKIVHQFSTQDYSSEVTCIGWSSNFTADSSSSVNIVKSFEPWKVLEDNELTDLQCCLDLPRDLSSIEIETSLPKLSVLPTGGNFDDVFCTRSTLDAVFRPLNLGNNNVVDVMIVGTKSGKMLISIYDTFLIGSFNTSTSDQKSSYLIFHASHKSSSTHALLMKDYEGADIQFVALDLRFISASSRYLSLLASRSTALQNLLRYIRQVQTLMAIEWRNTRELPEKFIRNINETLKERNEGDIVQALYHSAATGHTFPVVKEWLVNELTERGQRRWDKAVTTGLKNMKRIVHENMLPALERFSAILSRLLGIAKFQDSEHTVGFTSQQIKTLMDLSSCLSLISSRILMHTIDEIELFSSFSTWLRSEIERLASDKSDITDESSEKEASINYGKVLLYLQTMMTNSNLEVHFTKPSPTEERDATKISQSSQKFCESLNEHFQNIKKGFSLKNSILNIECIYEELSRQASTIFDQIADEEKRNVILNKGHPIGASEANSPVDMQLVIDKTLSYLLLSTVLVQIIRIILSIDNGKSIVDSVESFSVQLGVGTIKDMRFSNIHSLLVIWEDNGLSYLLQLPLEPLKDQETPSFNPHYAPHALSGMVLKSTMVANEDVTRFFNPYKIPHGDKFVAERLEVRRDGINLSKDDQRIIILGQEGNRYKVLTYK
ncbi:anaphase-promoting complex component Cut20/Apc4 [Blumeria hordei DH14]|uniref:Anaphase-promoting complex subunit 4 n=1 Tax=Blumeria graminis f. sp. hordei (strain DH14) TaxID=546991 RepID=N1JPP9_BLUG1|nr:anaphase-promoting complex component Cut20/Apc4 [Blumeria hordei DH14]